MAMQLSFPVEDNTPRGFLYIPEFISAVEEQHLLGFIRVLDFKAFSMYGVEAKRKIVHFGKTYDFSSRDISSAPSIPEWLLNLKLRSENILKDEVIEILVTHYPAGSAIGWHFDAPPFKSLFGISLLGSCQFQMRKGSSAKAQRFELELEPRSAYMISDESRWSWQHHIPPVKSDRYSLTFRTLKK